MVARAWCCSRWLHVRTYQDDFQTPLTMSTARQLMVENCTTKEELPSMSRRNRWKTFLVKASKKSGSLLKDSVSLVHLSVHLSLKSLSSETSSVHHGDSGAIVRPHELNSFCWLSKFAGCISLLMQFIPFRKKKDYGSIQAILAGNFYNEVHMSIKEVSCLNG